LPRFCSNRRRLGHFSRHELHVDMSRKMDHARSSKDRDINILLLDERPTRPVNETAIVRRLQHSVDAGRSCSLRRSCPLVNFKINATSPAPHIPARCAGAMMMNFGESAAVTFGRSPT
jgi:hypothetical protein